MACILLAPKKGHNIVNLSKGQNFRQNRNIININLGTSRVHVSLGTGFRLATLSGGLGARLQDQHDGPSGVLALGKRVGSLNKLN